MFHSGQGESFESLRETSWPSISRVDDILCFTHTLTHILWIGKCSFFRHSELKSLHSTDYRTFTGPKKGKCWEFLETAVPGWRHWDGSSTLEMVCTLGRGGRVSFAHLYLISALTQTRKQRKIGLMLAVIDTYSSLAELHCFYFMYRKQITSSSAPNDYFDRYWLLICQITM